MTCTSCGSAVGADDRFCASCGTALQARCATCGTELPEGARFCPSCGTATEPAGGGAERTRPAESERRVVSVLFADLVGFTASADGADPEDVRRRLEPYHRAIRDEVERYGGRIEKLMGDGVLAVFGAPVAHEDDPERAVRAALRIQDAVPAIPSDDMRARVAVGTGEVVALVEGTTMDREGLVGDVVNTASRLQQEAEPGTVLVDEATHRATRRAFRFEERPPLAVRGKAEPLSVWVAVEPTGRYGVDVDEDDDIALVGRESEMRLLVEAFARSTRDTTSQSVTITGDAGAGKSRLVRELRRHIDGLPDLIRWRQGRCLPYGEGVTFWALGEVVKAEAGILETDTPATAHGKLAVSLEQLAVDATDRAWITDRLAPLVGSAAGATADRSEQFAAWTAYLVALADQRPTVLVVEDLHWADPALVEFLSQLPQAARHVPLLLAATARPGFFDEHTAWGAGQRNALTIRLEALDPSSTRSLIDDLLAGEDVDDSTRAAVAERSGGNPLYAQEFARMVRDRRDEGADATVPDTVQAIVTARLDLLDPGAKAAVQAAAVVGKSFWSGAVQAVLENEVDVEAILGEVARRELVRRERTSTMAGETEYTFTHSVVRDVAYGLAPRAVRSRRHHRAARWIEGMAGDRVADRAELVAHHDAEALRLARAADVPEREDYGSIAAESHIRAADQARHLDVESQRSHLEAALELVDPLDPRRARLLADLGGALFASGPGDLAVKTLMEAREEAERVGEIETWGETSLRLSRALWVGGDPDTSDRTIDEVIERLEADAPTSTALASAYAQRAVGLWISGRPDEALAYIELVRPHVQAHGESFARSRLLSAEGGSRFDAGDPAAVERFRQALRMAVEQGDAVDISSTHLNLAEQLLTGWGPDEAEPVARRGLELAQKRGISGVATFLQGHLATSTFLQGRWDETLDLVEGARGSASAYIVGLFEGTELAIHVSRGVEPPRLAAAVAELVSEAEELRDLQAVVPTHVFAAFILAPAGHTEQALHHAREVVARAAGTRYLLDGLAMPLHLMRAGGELDAFEHLLPDLRRFDMPRPAAQVRLIEGLVAERDDPRTAIDAAREAAEELASLRANLDALFALAEAHRIAGAVGDEGARGDARRRANEVFGQAGAVRLFEFLGLAS